MPLHLLSRSEMGPNPLTFYAVAEAPGLLAGMSYPELGKVSWQALYDIGYRHVVCLTERKPRYNPAPLTVLFAACLDDLACGGRPDRAGRENGYIREAVSRIVPRLLEGEGVVVHCLGGTGRTGTIIACTLRELGVEASDVLAYMDDLNAARAKYAGWHGWPESEWQREQVVAWPGV